MDHTKNSIIDNIIENLKEQGFDKIYADVADHEPPFKIVNRKNGKEYTPEIIGEKDGITSIFTVETKIEKKIRKDKNDKWKFFRIYAKVNKGNLYIAGSDVVIAQIKKNLGGEGEIPANMEFLEVI